MPYGRQCTNHTEHAIKAKLTILGMNVQPVKLFEFMITLEVPTSSSLFLFLSISELFSAYPAMILVMYLLAIEENC